MWLDPRVSQALAGLMVPVECRGQQEAAAGSTESRSDLSFRQNY